ncbi:hypothetical protein [Methylobacterium sp. J-067]|uniref:hypothetical protein n=1 Tax=Methylobacterium sp. J-067 TaxID=2836648 RepID=UPI001FBA1E2D|nr:hypothetical protein [Methylobacterium sp. J-067]MCJ2023664.1 hypothetical protein [Methylobacterium sp. J-067]
MPVISTIGTVAGYTVTVNRRAAIGGDGVNGPSAITTTLSNGINSFDVMVLDDLSDSPRQARAAALALISGFAAIGAGTTLGAPGQSPTSASQTAPTVPNYVRAVTLTPGTPVAPGRGAFVRSGGQGPILLKLAQGGTVPVFDPSAGTGQLFNNFSVVDADISAAPGATVTVLY